MLCQFTFKNFKSYKHETILDLQAVSSQGFEDSLLRSGKDDKAFLPVSVIYGPNAGGKSNALNALVCLMDTILIPIQTVNGTPFQYYTGSTKAAPFLFDDSSKDEPTEFDLFFRPDKDYEYRYSLAVLSDVILSESLYRKKIGAKGHPATIFIRNNAEITLGSCIAKSNINTLVNERMPYLSFLAINYRLEPIRSAIEWFKNCFSGTFNFPFVSKMFFTYKDESKKEKYLKFMKSAGINIHDYIFNENEENTFVFKHIIGGKEYLLDFSQESVGTQKLFTNIPFINYALETGSLYAVDELDASLHPKLLKYIIMLFKNPEINKHGAQLIFTSHDVSTMKSSVFRTDEIWFACKQEDESSDLYSLSEIRDENNNRITPKAAFDKQYLEGRYGADPYFSAMKSWE